MDLNNVNIYTVVPQIPLFQGTKWSWGRRELKLCNGATCLTRSIFNTMKRTEDKAEFATPHSPFFTSVGLLHACATKVRRVIVFLILLKMSQVSVPPPDCCLLYVSSSVASHFLHKNKTWIVFLWVFTSAQNWAVLTSIGFAPLFLCS